MRILVAGVGYPNLSDLSLGPILADHLATRSWPEGIEVEDFSYGPIAILHSLGERQPYDRMVLVAAVKRELEPGSIRRSRWTHELPPANEIQARVVEAATGVISLENLLVVATHFQRLPAEVVILEVEPFDDSFGETMSDEFSALLDPLTGEIESVWAAPNPLPPLDDYVFIIPDAADRPTGWAVRPAWSESN